MIRRTYNNLTFAVKVSYSFTFLNDLIFRPRYVAMKNENVIDSILDFLYKENGANKYLNTVTQEIKDKISDTRQSLPDITLSVLIEGEFIMDIKITVTTKEKTVQEYEYPHAIDFSDFSYPREIQYLGQVAKDKIIKAYRRLAIKTNLAIFLLGYLIFTLLAMTIIFASTDIFNQPALNNIIP